MPTRTVLVIDDEDAVRTAVRLTLEDAGYAVLEASDGRAGLEVLHAASTPLVVLLDLMMPSMSGIEVLRALSLEPEVAAPHAFIIFSVARAFAASTLVLYLPDKPLLDLPKPFDIGQLVAVVGEAASQVRDDGASRRTRHTGAPQT